MKNYFKQLVNLVVLVSVSNICDAANIKSRPTSISIVSAPVQGTGWTQIANSKLQTVCPPNNFGGSGYNFFDYCPAVVTAWNSGFMDNKRNRLIVWGGGHNDYYGNELYAVNIDNNTIQRLTDPGLPLWPQNGSYGGPAIANGTQPNSRHTYDGIGYIDSLDKMFVFGGIYGGVNGASGNDVWLFDFATMKWERKFPSGPTLYAGPGFVSGYDPITNKILIHDTGTLYSYDPVANVMATASNYTPMDYHLTGVVDPDSRKFVLLGSGSVYVFDLSVPSPYPRQTLVTSGGSAVVNASYPGIAYDSKRKRVTAWAGGNTVYTLNIATKAWTAHTFTGGPGPQQGNGTYKRFSYSKKSDVFVLENDMNDNVYLFRPAN